MVGNQTFDEIKRRLIAGEMVDWRRCSVCNDRIYFRVWLDKRDIPHPEMVSCYCREKGRSNVVALNWSQLQAMVG